MPTTIYKVQTLPIWPVYFKVKVFVQSMSILISKRKHTDLISNSFTWEIRSSMTNCYFKTVNQIEKIDLFANSLQKRSIKITPIDFECDSFKLKIHGIFWTTLWHRLGLNDFSTQNISVTAIYDYTRLIDNSNWIQLDIFFCSISK